MRILTWDETVLTGVLEGYSNSAANVMSLL
jgi:hypothetical protein